MFVFYDWPFPHMCFAKNIANNIFPFNSWLSFQRLCRPLWGLAFNASNLQPHITVDCNPILIMTYLKKQVLMVANGCIAMCCFLANNIDWGHAWVCPTIFLKVPVPVRDPGTHPKQQLDRCSHFRTAHTCVQQTNRQTDRQIPPQP